MRLIIITQKVDMHDDNLGFFHHWIEKLAEKIDRIYVICLWRGEYNLPQNVEVYSMGKEMGMSKLGRFFRLQKYLFTLVKDTDGVFIHMAPIYAVASFPAAKVFGKKIVLWYTHGSRNRKLWLAEKLVSKIVTASKESFRIKSKKVKILGHGIDTELFSPAQRERGKFFSILTAGRMTPSKDLETQILALDVLIKKQNIKNIRFTILGSPYEGMYPGYFSGIKALIKNKGIGDHIVFGGSMPNYEMPKYYQSADLFINTSTTGSIDKTVLEAMSCGTLVISSNEAFFDVLGPASDRFLFAAGDYKALAENIKYVMDMIVQKRDEISSKLRGIVVRKHNLNNLVGEIIKQFS